MKALRAIGIACALALGLGCKEPAASDAPVVVPQPKPAPAASAATKPVPAAAAPAVAADPNEACGQMLLVSYVGAAHAKPGVTRDKGAAAQRAHELLEQLQGGADFAELASAQSDAPSSAPRGGVFGTFKKDAWPPLHATLRDPLFALKIGEVASQPVEADYGYALLRRCPIEKAHARHILIRYRGATTAPARITRSKAEAERETRQLLLQLRDGADFGGIATAASEDGSAKRGGDIGVQPRGALAWQFERALFALKPGEHSDVVETEFGFHIIERLPD